ncbi:MAG: CARDB domain-containing protein, partial [bacterium]
PSTYFEGTSTGSHTLTETNLPDGEYFWRIKVLNPNLANLYSDIGWFEIITEEPQIDPEFIFQEGNVGEAITLRGSNWPPDKLVSIHFGTHQTIATTITSTNGTFSITFIVSTQPYGTTIITAEGCIATAIFFIKPKIAIKPLSGNIGESITLNGTGFTKEAIISIDFGTSISITTTISSTNGTFSVIFIANLQPQGTTIISARGPSDDIATDIFYLQIPSNLPDLIVEKIKVCPSHIIKQYQRVKIIAFIKNIGTQDANVIKVIFLDGTNQIDGTKTIGHLAPGEVKIRHIITRPKTIGTHTITVIVDPSNTIQELREDNNIATTTILVKPGQGIMGTITDKQTGNPIAGTCVFAIGCDFGMDLTDKDGHYIISDLKPGCYIVLAIKCGYYPQGKCCKVKKDEFTILNFELKQRTRTEEISDYNEVLSAILTAMKEKEALEIQEELPINPEFEAEVILTLSKQEEIPFIENQEPILLTIKPNKTALSLNDELILNLSSDNQNLALMNLRLEYDKTKLRLMNEKEEFFLGTSGKTLIFKAISEELGQTIKIIPISARNKNNREIQAQESSITITS